MPDIRYRVCRDLLVSFRDGKPLAERSLTGDQVQISADVLMLLAVWRDGMTAAELGAELTSRGYATTEQDASSALGVLAAAGVLEADGGDGQRGEADRVAADPVWGSWWGSAAARFHYSTRYDHGLDGTDLLEEPPVPVPMFQRYRGVPLTRLPAPEPLPLVPFGDVLARRRTVREYGPRPLTIQQVSQLLYHTHFPHHLMWSPLFGWLPRRAYANGGARGELELYLVARGVAGLDRGVYHYQVDGHQLARLGPAPDDDHLRRVAQGQDMCVAAPLTVVVTAVPRRAAVKYRLARALRVVYLDTGCLSQTFYLVATALGLGAFATAAYSDTAAERILGIDGIRESSLLMLGAGVPAEQPRDERLLPCPVNAALPAELLEDLEPGGPDRILFFERSAFAGNPGHDLAGVGRGHAIEGLAGGGVRAARGGLVAGRGLGVAQRGQGGREAGHVAELAVGGDGVLVAGGGPFVVAGPGVGEAEVAEGVAR
jgi:SagB-type dehydrogenase family enzyme